MRISGLLIILLLLGQTAFAGALAREDFAAGFALQFQPAGAVHGLLLPEKIYTTVVHADLADIRVFNGAGNVVPHLLRLEQAEPAQIVREEEVPFSPLHDLVPDQTVRRIETQISRGAEGTGKGPPVAITQSIRDKREMTRQLNGYLLDMSAITVAPFRLRFTVGGEGDFMATVTLEGSDDLTNWTFLSRETLARFNYQGHRLEKNADSLIQGKKKYIRLSWPAGEQGLHIDGIRAVSSIDARPPVRNWTALPAVLPEKQATERIVLEYDSKGFLPVDTIRVGLAGSNNLIQGVIKSRPDREAGWRIRGQGTFYRLQQQGVALRHDTLSVPMTTDRYWQLEIAAEDGAFSRDVLPQLELGWQPHKLYFLDQGAGPYILAFGSGRLAPSGRTPQNGLQKLLADIDQQKTGIQTALLGNEMALGGPAMLIALPPPPPWKKWLLWGVLISGVLLIGGMSCSLYRQMRSARNSGQAGKES